MRILLYNSPGAYSAFGTDRAKVEATIRRIAQGTNTRGLVVVIHLFSNSSSWGGAFYSRDVSKRALCTMRGPWREAHSSGIPPGLPDKFPMIEVSIGSLGTKYPKMDYNQNGFRVWFKSFRSHLAYILAHELHHYRRYKLGLHVGEGERGADKWAAGRACEQGYGVILKPYKVEKSKGFRTCRKRAVPAKLSSEYRKRIRGLRRWSLVRLIYSDNRRVPAGTFLKFLRPMRASYRALVLDHRGEERVVPIDWLRIVQE